MQQRSKSRLVNMLKYSYLCVIFFYFLQLTQHCDAVVTRDVKSADIPSEMFKTVEAATEKPLVFNTVPPTSNQQQQNTGSGNGISESTKTSVSSHSNSEAPFSTFVPQNQFVPPPRFGPSLQHSIYRPTSNMIQGTYPSDPMPIPYPTGPRSGAIQHFETSDYPFNGGNGNIVGGGGGGIGGSGMGGGFYYSSSSNGPVGRAFPSGFDDSFPSRPSSRFQTGPGFMSGNSFGGGGGVSGSGFYKISSSQTSYDSNVGVPITNHFEYDSRNGGGGGGIFRRK